ncbi:hypothetical protein N0V83_009192 [Neocucurbitaria cava]|uniref:Uncharacterized protein n=1 Tax=Neocucurbitaria cava TaxID=798079 RepID=A0A9W8Y293_9PLEO|nr:hypothetical protein N0V83_009192 [Neocucurbitaria cava]
MSTGNFDIPEFATKGEAVDQEVRVRTGLPKSATVPNLVAYGSDLFDDNRNSQMIHESTFVEFEERHTRPSQMYITPAKRKPSQSEFSPLVSPNKRMRVESAQSEETSSDDQMPAKLLAVDDLAPISSTPTAAQLISKRKFGLRLKRSIPWGVQRILTRTIVEQQAAIQRISVPLILDDGVRNYCHSSAPFDPVYNTFPPASVDIRLLRPISITVEELLTFFPNHLKWHDAIYRLAQNGWSCGDMAKYINLSRGLLPKGARRGNTILKWLQAADKDILGLDRSGSTGRKSWKTTCFTVKGWTPYPNIRGPGVIDYRLVDLADGVAQWPENQGARLLTRAVKHAIMHMNRDVRLSQIQGFIRENLLMIPSLNTMIKEVNNGKHPDVVANEWYRSLLLKQKNARIV